MREGKGTDKCLVEMDGGNGIASMRSGEHRPDQSPVTLPKVGESGRTMGSIAVSLHVTRFLIFEALAGFFNADCLGEMGMIVDAAVETVDA